MNFEPMKCKINLFGSASISEPGAKQSPAPTPTPPPPAPERNSGAYPPPPAPERNSGAYPTPPAPALTPTSVPTPPPPASERNSGAYPPPDVFSEYCKVENDEIMGILDDIKNDKEPSKKTEPTSTPTPPPPPSWDIKDVIEDIPQPKPDVCVPKPDIDR